MRNSVFSIFFVPPGDDTAMKLPSSQMQFAVIDPDYILTLSLSWHSLSTPTPFHPSNTPSCGVAYSRTRGVQRDIILVQPK